METAEGTMMVVGPFCVDRGEASRAGALTSYVGFSTISRPKAPPTSFAKRARVLRKTSVGGRSRF